MLFVSRLPVCLFVWDSILQCCLGQFSAHSPASTLWLLGEHATTLNLVHLFTESKSSVSTIVILFQRHLGCKENIFVYSMVVWRVHILMFTCSTSDCAWEYIQQGCIVWEGRSKDCLLCWFSLFTLFEAWSLPEHCKHPRFSFVCFYFSIGRPHLAFTWY